MNTMRRPRQSRRILAFLCTLLAAAGLTTVTAPAAQADVLDLTCVGSSLITYSPGLTLTPKPTTVSTTFLYGPCVSLTKPEVNSGSSVTPGGVPRTISCVDLSGTATGTRTLTWNTGQTSTFQFVRTSMVAAGQLIVRHTGNITAGLFAGDSAVQVTAGPANLLDCLNPEGITSIAGVVTLEITSL